jgi:phospho-N-acetylmuramoyl-pentapeptide-transferase
MCRMALVCLVWLGGVGAVDDWLKLTSNARASTSRQGLTAQEKLLFQIGLAVVLSVFTYRYSIDQPATLSSFRF